MMLDGLRVTVSLLFGSRDLPSLFYQVCFHRDTDRLDTDVKVAEAEVSRYRSLCSVSSEVFHIGRNARVAFDEIDGVW